MKKQTINTYILLCVGIFLGMTIQSFRNSEYQVNLEPDHVEIQGTSNKSIYSWEELDTISVSEFFLRDNL